MTNFWRCVVAPLALLVCSTALGNEDTQPTDSIERAVRTAAQERAHQHGYEDVSVDVRRLDPRLRLARCEAPLDTRIPPASAVLGAISVAVSCQGVSPWTVYVRSHVTAMQNIPVLNKPLARHAIISASDLDLVRQPIGQTIGGTVFDSEQLVGMQLTRALDAGATLRLSNLRKPDVIKRGQQVTLVSGTGGLEVRIAGKALDNAAEGERVTVSNLSSGKRVQGIAHADGTVSVQ